MKKTIALIIGVFMLQAMLLPTAFAKTVQVPPPNAEAPNPPPIVGPDSADKKITTPLEVPFAGTKAEPNAELKDAKFEVKDFLNLGENEQGQSYFKDSNGKASETPILNFAVRIIEFATQVVGTLAMIVLIIGGFMLMVAQGEQQKIEDAKELIKYAIIGLIIIFLSYTIVLFIQSIFQIS